MYKPLHCGHTKLVTLPLIDSNLKSIGTKSCSSQSKRVPVCVCFSHKHTLESATRKSSCPFSHLSLASWRSLSLLPSLPVSPVPKLGKGCPEPQKPPLPESPGMLAFLLPQNQGSRGKAAPGAGRRLAHWSSWASRCGIGPGGHPMGGVSAALAGSWNSVGKEWVGVEGSPHSPPQALALGPVLQAACQSRLRDYSKPPTYRAWGRGEGRSLQFTESLCDHTDLGSNSSSCFSPLCDLQWVT